MTIKFQNFWGGFEPEEHLLYSLASSYQGPKDLIIESVFQSRLTTLIRRQRSLKFSRPRKRTKTKELRVWYTGENRRVPFEEKYDLTLSFDQDSYGGLNFYLPLIYVELFGDSKESISRRGIQFEKEKLTETRPYDERSGFICAFLSNPEPVRLRAISELAKLGSVDVFGPAVKKPVRDKYSVARNYKYMLCFENDLFPGYVTEKLLDAYVCGTVPLYYGDLGQEKFLNRESFVNLADFEKLDIFIEYIRNIDKSSYFEIHRKPLFLNLPNLDSIYKAFSSL